VEVEADRPPPAALLDELREWRSAIARMLAEQAITPEPGVLVGDDDDPERQAMAAYYAEPPTPQPYRPSDPDRYTAGLLVSALMRPPSWSGSTPPPPKGAWCGCCGHTQRSGGRWWRPRHPVMDGSAPGGGWRCWTCHPPPDPTEVVEVRT
jgi:hypothetical protein